MSDRINTADSATSLTQLVGGIVTDIQTLVRQELQLAKSEMRQEWAKTKTAAGAMAAGAGLLILAGIVLCFAAVYLLSALAPGLPLWACFGIIGACLAMIGGILVVAGSSKAADVHVLPPQTVESMKENVQWLQNRT
jgi:Flp pilus assembly protein TadB